MRQSLVTFSDHALDRMESRTIQERWVISVLANPDRVFLGSRGNPIAERSLGRIGVLRVVFVERIGPQGRQTHVVTVMWK